MADSPKVSFRIPQTIWDEFLKEIEKDPLVESPSQKIRELIIEYVKDCRNEGGNENGRSKSKSDASKIGEW